MLTTTIAATSPELSEPVHGAAAVAANTGLARLQTRGHVLLQASQGTAAGQTGKEQNIPIMLDTGSNQSFIRTDVAQVLNCRELAPDSIQIQSFGGDMSQQEMRRAELSLKSLKERKM